MKFTGIKLNGYNRLAELVSSLKEADRAALPTDPDGMIRAAEAYAKQMEQLGLPIHDDFWDKYKDFTYNSQVEDTQYMQLMLEGMSKRVQDIMQDPEFYINRPAPQNVGPQKESPDVFTSVKPWSTNGMTFDKLQEGVDAAAARWEQEVKTHEQDPYSIFWDDLAAFNEAVQWENYDAALELHNKITQFEDNYAEAQQLGEEPSEAESMDFKKMMSRKVSISLRRNGPKPRKDKTLSLLEEILGKPVKSLYDEEGDVGDEGEDWFNQEPDFGSKGPQVENPVFEVEVEDSPEEEEFVQEKKEVDPFEL